MRVQVLLSKTWDRDILYCLRSGMDFGKIMLYAIDSYLDGSDELISVPQPGSAFVTTKTRPRPSFSTRTARQDALIESIPFSIRSKVLKAILRRVLPVENTELVREHNGSPAIDYGIRFKTDASGCGIISIAEEQATDRPAPQNREKKERSDPKPPDLAFSIKEPDPDPMPETLPDTCEEDDLDSFFDTYSDISM